MDEYISSAQESRIMAVPATSNTLPRTALPVTAAAIATPPPLSRKLPNPIKANPKSFLDNDE